MPYAAGVYSLFPTGNPVVSGTSISSLWANNTLNDIASGLSTCVLKDGSQTLTANIPMSSFKLTGLAAGSTAGDSVRYEQVSLLGTLTAKGDTYVATASGVVTRLPVGANGTVAVSRSADANGIAYSAILRGQIAGLILSNNAGDATNDIDIAVGGAQDSTNAYWMTLAAAITKRLDAAWAVGTNQGGLDTGAIGNAVYYLWLIARSDTGVVDVLFSLSATAPTMPANYDFKRRIGTIIRAGATILPFNHFSNNRFLLTTPVADQTALAVGAARSLVTVTAPPNMLGLLRVTEFVAAGVGLLVIQPTTETDAAPALAASPGASLSSEAVGGASSGEFQVWVDASRQIAVRAAAANTLTGIYTQGWIDTRGVNE